MGYVPPRKQPIPAARQVPPLPSGKCRVEEPRLSPASKEKHEMKKQRKEKETTTTPFHEEKE